MSILWSERNSSRSIDMEESPSPNCLQIIDHIKLNCYVELELGLGRQSGEGERKIISYFYGIYFSWHHSHSYHNILLRCISIMPPVILPPFPSLSLPLFLYREYSLIADWRGEAGVRSSILFSSKQTNRKHRFSAPLCSKFWIYRLV